MASRQATAVLGHIRKLVAVQNAKQLSDREFQVMQQLAAGNSLKEIADELSLSVKTISTFRCRILQKLKLQNNVEMAHYAREHGLLEQRNP